MEKIRPIYEKTIKAEAATATAAAKVSATGNGSSYTQQNIKTVKEPKANTFSNNNNNNRKSKESSNTNGVKTEKMPQQQQHKQHNNKTEIKTISCIKQRNYLKFLINLFIKLQIIFCIQQINDIILNINKITNKLKINYKNIKNNNSQINEICIIKPQKQKKLSKALLRYPTFSFMLRNLFKFLFQFIQCSRETLEKYYVKIILKKILHVKPIIRKHFKGICPKRLISLKRLQTQQIPEKLQAKKRFKTKDKLSQRFKIVKNLRDAKSSQENAEILRQFKRKDNNLGCWLKKRIQKLSSQQKQAFEKLFTHKCGQLKAYPSLNKPTCQLCFIMKKRPKDYKYCQLRVNIKCNEMTCQLFGPKKETNRISVTKEPIINLFKGDLKKYESWKLYVHLKENVKYKKNNCQLIKENEMKSKYSSIESASLQTKKGTKGEKYYQLNQICQLRDNVKYNEITCQLINHQGDIQMSSLKKKAINYQSSCEKYYQLSEYGQLNENEAESSCKKCFQLSEYGQLRDNVKYNKITKQLINHKRDIHMRSLKKEATNHKTENENKGESSWQLCKNWQMKENFCRNIKACRNFNYKHKNLKRFIELKTSCQQTLREVREYESCQLCKNCQLRDRNYNNKMTCLNIFNAELDIIFPLKESTDHQVIQKHCQLETINLCCQLNIQQESSKSSPTSIKRTTHQWLFKSLEELKQIPPSSHNLKCCQLKFKSYCQDKVYFQPIDILFSSKASTDHQVIKGNTELDIIFPSKESTDHQVMEGIQMNCQLDTRNLCCQPNIHQEKYRSSPIFKIFEELKQIPSSSQNLKSCQLKFETCYEDKNDFQQYMRNFWLIRSLENFSTKSWQLQQSGIRNKVIFNTSALKNQANKMFNDRSSSLSSNFPSKCCQLELNTKSRIQQANYCRLYLNVDKKEDLMDRDFEIMELILLMDRKCSQLSEPQNISVLRFGFKNQTNQKLKPITFNVSELLLLLTKEYSQLPKLSDIFPDNSWVKICKDLQLSLENVSLLGNSITLTFKFNKTSGRHVLKSSPKMSCQFSQHKVAFEWRRLKICKDLRIYLANNLINQCTARGKQYQAFVKLLWVCRKCCQPNSNSKVVNKAFDNCPEWIISNKSLKHCMAKANQYQDFIKLSWVCGKSFQPNSNLKAVNEAVDNCPEECVKSNKSPMHCTAKRTQNQAFLNILLVLRKCCQLHSNFKVIYEAFDLIQKRWENANRSNSEEFSDKSYHFQEFCQIDTKKLFKADYLVKDNNKISNKTRDIHRNITPELADIEAFKSTKQIHFNTNNFYKNSKHDRQKKTESKEEIFLKKCQHFLYNLLFFYFNYFCCCCCLCRFWHIFGFPLVLEKIFKYFKDSTVHVLTRRLKISTSGAAASVAIALSYSATSATKQIATRKRITATSRDDDDETDDDSFNYSNIIAAAYDGNLKEPTKMADYEANQEENVLKSQTHLKACTVTTSRATKTFCNCSHTTSSSCSTTSLTKSSSVLTSSSSTFYGIATSPENWKLLQQCPQNTKLQTTTCTQYCRYQQNRHHHHHQDERHYHHHQHHNRQQDLQTQQHQHQQHHPTTSNSTIIHLLQLPSLSRTLIILILLSSLWHTSEGFHGSGVKLSSNTVKTKFGLVRGIVVRSAPSLVEAYLGIPYASPPVGSLRFMPPITPSPWKNVRNADRFSPVCPQNVPIPPNGPEALLEVPRARLAQLRRLLPLLSNQSEDCLYLNIYVPYENRRHRRFTTNSGETNDTPKLPTILFIHGESYEWNSGNPYDGSELAAHGNVIVVTINFRLGILGFLKTGGKESAQGNFGLMDLVAGLHWLKQNLPAFGGDPQAITLLGHGTGAALANILVVSPVASDLIQHTVLVSGSALSPWAIQKNPLFVKRRVAEQTGCHGDMLYYDLAPCLRTKTVAELLAVKVDHPRFLVGFAPFIDGTVISPNTDYIGKLSLPLGSAIVSTSGIEYANFPKRNLIFCLTSVESHLDLSAQDLEFGFNETRRDRILRTYVRNNFHYHLNEIFAVLKNEYTDWDKAIRSPLSSRDATLQFLSDGHTASSLIKLGYMHSLRGGRGYFLHFKHRTVEEEYPQRTGSVRGEDVPFWLGLPISPLFPHNYTTQEKQISRLMLRYLANFAKTGNPNQSTVSSSFPSSSSLIGSPQISSSSSPSSTQAAADTHDKVKRSSLNIVNASSSLSPSSSSSSSSSSSLASSSGPIKSNTIVVDVETAAAREALNLAVLYNQRRTKRTYYKRHSRSNDDHSGSSSSASSEVNYFISTNNNNNNKLDSDELPFWDAYDVVNQLYMELGNKAEIQSHYRGHKLSMWLNLIPQLHRHANMNDQSMRHHQFQDDLNNLNLYEGIVRAQIQIKPDDDEETLLLPKGRPTTAPTPQETNTTQKPMGGTTECGVDGAMFVAEMTTTVPPSDNRSLVLDSREKEMATASTGLIGNLEVLRRLSGKQFQSYTTALVATVAVGCFLLILNILIFAGIYHQREKRARDAKTKEELQDNDTSKNSSLMKLNAMGSETGSYNGSGAGVSGKTTVVFGEYSCYDEKSLQTKDEKLIVELPPPQMVDPNWAACSTSTLDLLKTKHHTPLDASYTLSNVVPINTETQTEHLMPSLNALEMSTYNPLPMTAGLIIDPALAATSSSGLLSKRGSFVGSASQLNQYDFASVQSSDQMSFKDIENAVKASATMDDDITQDDDIPEPPPPPRSFHNMQQQQQGVVNPSTSSSGSAGGGILRQAGTSSATQTGGGKKRVHIQEISV